MEGNKVREGARGLTASGVAVVHQWATQGQTEGASHRGQAAPKVTFYAGGCKRIRERAINLLAHAALVGVGVGADKAVNAQVS